MNRREFVNFVTRSLGYEKEYPMYMLFDNKNKDKTKRNLKFDRLYYDRDEDFEKLKVILGKKIVDRDGTIWKVVNYGGNNRKVDGGVLVIWFEKEI